MTIPHTILLGKAPSGLPASDEADAWRRHMRTLRKRVNRVAYGPRAPKRKRRRRLAKKITRRGGMLRCRGPVQDLLAAIGKQFPEMKR